MSAAPVEEFEVEDLDASGVLEAAAQAEQAERRASAMKLRLAHQWAILNPATSQTGVATPGGPALDVLTKIDEGGPPGQTHPDALACLCRRHHRAKTLGLWRYARTPEGHYLWHGPRNATYLVTDTGTHRL